MVSQADLVRGTLKKISKATKSKIKSTISERGRDIATAALATIIRNKTGLDVGKASIIANIVTKKFTKEIRDRLKN